MLPRTLSKAFVLFFVVLRGNRCLISALFLVTNEHRLSLFAEKHIAAVRTLLVYRKIPR